MLQAGLVPSVRIIRDLRLEADPVVSTLMRRAASRRSIAAANALRLSPPASGMPSNTAGAHTLLGFGLTDLPCAVAASRHRRKDSSMGSAAAARSAADAIF